jgi:hypothetical protein
MVPLSEGPFHLADYVDYVQEFMRHIGPEVHVISVCQPTVPVLAAVSLMASRGEPTPLTMTMMGGPIDARHSPTDVNHLAVNKSHSWFENNVIFRVPPNFPGAGRRVYPGFLQYTGFVAMNPDRHATSHYDYFQDLIKGDDESAESHRQFYDEYNAVLDMPAEYYLDTIKTVFQDFALVNGTWVVNGEPVRPQDITTTALLTIEGELDDITGGGPDQGRARPVRRHPQGRQFHYDVEGAGPLRHLLRPPLAREGLPRGEPASSAASTERAERRGMCAAQEGPRPIIPAVNAPPPLPDFKPRAGRRLDAALPQTQCTRCGYPDCRGYAQAMADGEAGHQPLPARRRRRHHAGWP